MIIHSGFMKGKPLYEKQACQKRVKRKRLGFTWNKMKLIFGTLCGMVHFELGYSV